jgi:hypothetical protein
MVVIEVNSPDYKTASAPDILDAGAGNCVLIGAIYDTQGAMVHLPDKSVVLDKMLNDLNNKVQDKSIISLYVAGCALYSGPGKQHNKRTLEVREWTLERIRVAKLSSQIKTLKWGEWDSVQGLQLILEEGIAVYDQINDDPNDYE